MSRERFAGMARKTSRLLLLPPLVWASTACGIGGYASNLYTACVRDEEPDSSSRSVQGIDSRRHVLVIENLVTGEHKRMLSLGLKALEVSNTVNIGDEIKYRVTVNIPSIVSLMTPAATQKYAERREKEIARSAVLTIDSPDKTDAESIKIEKVQHQGCQPQSPVKPT